MVTSRAAVQTSGLLAAAIIAGAIGLAAAGLSERTHPEPVATASAAAQPPRAADPAPRIVLSGRVEASSRNALEARRQLEREIRAIARLAATERGEVTLGASRYRRTGRAEAAETHITQHLDIALPDAAARERFDARFLRARSAVRDERNASAGGEIQAPSRASGVPPSSWSLSSAAGTR